eukprot:6892496-Ditylum_brightwellii.AAC.1
MAPEMAFWHQRKILARADVPALQIIHCNAIEPRQAEALPVYAIVDFPSINIPEEDKCFPDLPRTTVPVPCDFF